MPVRKTVRPEDGEMSTTGRVTRGSSRARSDVGDFLAPTPVRRGVRGVRKTPMKASAQDKPAVSNKNSKAYGSSGKIAAPAYMETDQALRPAEDRFKEALAAAQSHDTRQMDDVDEEHADNNKSEEIQSQVDSQLHGEISRTDKVDHDEDDADDNLHDPLRGADQPSSFLSTWAPRGVFDHATEDPNAPTQSSFFSRSLDSLNSLVTRIVRSFLTLFDIIISWLQNLGAMLVSLASNRAFLWIVISLLTFLALNMTYGPLLPLKSDPADSQALRSYQTNGTKWLGFEQLERLSKRVIALENRDTASSKKIIDSPKINWFELGSGARVNLRLTSPSLAASKSDWFSYAVARLSLRQQTRIPITGTAAEALTKWEDGGRDRWCTSQSQGRMQIVVSTLREVIPEELIVEHASKDRSVHVAHAPKEVELWIEVSNPTAHHEINEFIAREYPHLHKPSSPQLHRQSKRQDSLSSDFVPIGRWEYNVHSGIEVQVLRVELPLSMYNIQSRTFAVRVNSNWGRVDSTCVNRFRLQGVDASGEVEYLDPAP